MRAYVVASNVRVSPFGELAKDLPIAGVTLAEWRSALFRKFGLEEVAVARLEDVPTDAPCLVTRDHVLFTRRVLKSFLQRWRAVGHAKSVRVALPASSLFVRSFADLQDLVIDGEHALYDLWGLAKGGRVEDAAPLAVVFKEKVLDYRMPKNLTGLASWPYPVTSSVCLHVSHWLHVLQANRLAIQIRWVDHVIGHPLWAASVLLRGLIPGRGRLVWRIARHANVIGRDVDIHPTARVEGSFLGDGVRVGPMAIVRASIVGANTVLEERTNVSYSVVGPGSFVSKNAVVYASASMEDADLGMTGMQMCLVGRRAALTPRATPTDVIPGRKIKVKVGDHLEEIDVPVLGACFGHDTFIGADLYIAPGREIPNGVRLGPQPERVLSSIPDDLEPGRMYTIRGGRLAPP
ncbi:hypothetical protein L6R52_38575 [Myxococcota bacterium]|nr:hypothetical protein [Myxococcota bacterium]